MNSVGIDLHRKRSQIAVIDEQRRAVAVAADRERPRDVLSCWPSWTARRRSQSRRPTAGSGWLSCSEDAGYEIHLAHPLRTQAIAAATGEDRRGRRAARSRTCCAPICCRRPMSLRASCVTCASCLRHRIVLTRMRSALKNRVHALLAKQGITREHADLFGKGGRAFLAELALREAPRRRLDSLLSADRRLRPRDRAGEAEIDAARQGRRPRVDVLCQTARHRPLHGDARSSPRSARSNASATPATSAPGPASPRPSAPPTAKHGSATSPGRAHRTLRWALVEAAQKAATGGGPLRAALRADRQTPRPQDRQGRGRQAAC